jgi:hypothetical protein
MTGLAQPPWRWLWRMGNPDIGHPPAPRLARSAGEDASRCTLDAPMPWTEPSHMRVGHGMAKPGHSDNRMSVPSASHQSSRGGVINFGRALPRAGDLAGFAAPAEASSPRFIAALSPADSGARPVYEEKIHQWGKGGQHPMPSRAGRTGETETGGAALFAIPVLCPDQHGSAEKRPGRLFTEGRGRNAASRQRDGPAAPPSRGAAIATMSC